MAPTPKMSAIRAVLLYAIAVPTDIFRFIFLFLIFVAPFMTAKAVELYLLYNEWPTWAAGFVSTIAGLSTAAAEWLLAPLTLAIAAFGVVMAFAVGLFGWMVFVTALFLFGINPFAPKLLFKTAGGLALLSVTAFFIVRDTRKEDRKLLKEFKVKEEQERAARESQALYLQQQIAAQNAAPEESLNEIPEEEPLPA